MKRTASLLLLSLCGCGTEAPALRGDPVALASGERAFLQGDYELAAERFALAAEAGDREAGIWQARSLMKLEEWAAAERAFRSGLSLPGEAGFQARFGLGECLLAQSRPEEALRPLKELASDPAAMEALEPPAVLYKAAVAQMRCGDWEEAGRRLKQVRDGWPDTSWAVLALERLGDVSARRFSVQLGAYAQAAAAEKRIADLRSAGIAAVRVPVRRAGAELFAIREGAFATYREALNEISRLKGLGEDGVVVP